MKKKVYKAKGFQRRRMYYCMDCLNPIMEYPGLVINRNELVCEDCQKEREQDRERMRQASIRR